MTTKGRFLQDINHIACVLFILAAVVAIPLRASNFVQPQHLNAFRDAAVYSACQDSSGAIWLNTSYGVFTFDGIQARMMLQPIIAHSLECNGSNLVYSVSYLGIHRFDIRHREPQLLKSSISGWHESSMLAVGDSLWVAHRNSLYVSRGDSLETVGCLPEADFLCIAKRNDSTLVLGDREGDVYLYDGHFKRIFKASAGVAKILTETNGNLWIGLMNGGIFLIRRDSSVHWIEGTLPQKEVRSICELGDGDFLVGAADGLFRVSSGDLTCIPEHSGIPNKEAIWDIFKDRDGNTWVCTYYSGLWYRDKTLSAFDILPESNSLKMVRGIAEDFNRNLWIFTDNHGMFRLDPKGKLAEIPHGRGIKFQTAVFDKSSGEIWAGSFQGAMYRWNPRNGEWNTVLFKDSNGNSFDETVSAILILNNELYLGTSRGLYIFDPATEHCISRHIPGYSRSIYAISKIDDRQIAISGIGTYIYDIKTNSFHPLPVTGSCADIQVGRNGELFVAVTGTGLCRISATGGGEVYQFPEQRLIDAYVNKLLPFGDSCLMVTSSQGVSIVREDGSQSRIFKAANGLGISSFREGCLMRTLDGRILAGGKDGIIAFNPSSFSENETATSRPCFAEISINGETISTKERIPFLNDIVLRPGQTNLSVEVSTFDYSGTRPISWSYKLNGADNDWTSFIPDNPIVYMNLRPGRYRLHVRYWEGEDIASAREIALGIRLKAYWYSTTFAKTAYIILSFAILIILLSMLYSRMLLRQRLKFEKTEGMRRMRLFVDVSRSLREPLSMILGQLELFFQRYAASSPQGLKYIERSYSNALNMQTIISGYVDLENENEEITQVQALHEEPQKAPIIAASSERTGLRVLLAVDDPDNRAMLRSIFGRSYDILVSSDAEEAFSCSLKEQPDIIVCDLKSGFDKSLELCTKIRHNFETCHIPYVLLTSHASEYDSIKGARMGVDAVIVKPFRTDTLIEQCKTLLDNRKILQKKYAIAPQTMQPRQYDRKDYYFLNAAIGAVERNLYSDKLNVTVLCQELHVSKTALNTKLKSISGRTPREFIEDIRLRHAAQMLLDSNKLVSEISDELGFSSYRYFISRFKKHFGVTPSQFNSDMLEKKG